MKRLSVLSSESIIDRTTHTGYHFPKVEIKDYNIINGKKVLDQAVKNEKVKKLVLVKEMITQIVAC